jgi:hypothetical protein
VDNGASAVYMGFRDDTNARHFAGLNLKQKYLFSADFRSPTQPGVLPHGLITCQKMIASFAALIILMA